MTNQVAMRFLECIVDNQPTHQLENFLVDNDYATRLPTWPLFVVHLKTARKAVREYKKLVGFTEEEYWYWNFMHSAIHGRITKNTTI